MFLSLIICIIGVIIKFGCSLVSKKFGFTSKTWSFGHSHVSIDVLIIAKLLSGISIPCLLCIMGPFIRTSNDSTRNSCWVINLNLPVGVHPANIPCFFRKSIPKIQGLIRFLQTTKVVFVFFLFNLEFTFSDSYWTEITSIGRLNLVLCIGLVVGSINC